MKRKANPRPPRQDTESGKEGTGMEGTQFLYCQTRKGQPRVNIEVCLTKCKKAKKCKPLKDYQATGDPTEGKTDLIIDHFKKEGIPLKIIKTTEPDPTPTLEVDHVDHLHIIPQFTADKTHRGSDFSNVIDQATDRNKGQLDLFNFVERKE